MMRKSKKLLRNQAKSINEVLVKDMFLAVLDSISITLDDGTPSIVGHDHDDRYYTKAESNLYFYNKTYIDSNFSPLVHYHIASDISDFSEAVDDRISVLVENGTGLTWSYNDGLNKFIPTVSLSPFNSDQLDEGSTNLYATALEKSHWDTAYGWGNHALSGYLTTSTADTTYLKHNYLNGRVLLDANASAGTGITAYYLSSVATNRPSGTDNALLTLSYSSFWSVQMAGDWRTNNWHVRNQENGTWGTWAKLWHSANDGTGSGLDADLLDGYESAVAATISTVAVRNTSGDLLSRVFRMDSSVGVQSGTITGVMGMYSDGYIYPYDAASVKTFLGLGSAITGTGTTNRLPYWASSSTLGSSILEFNGTQNVNVQSTGAEAGFVLVNNGAAKWQTASFAGSGYGYYSYVTSQLEMMVYESGGVYIRGGLAVGGATTLGSTLASGTHTVTGHIYVSGYIFDTSNSEILAGADGGGFYFASGGTSPVLPIYIGGTNTTFTSFAYGNVGIGTTSPSYKLQVNGETYVQGNVRISGTNVLYFDSYNGGWYMSDSVWLRSYAGKSIWVGAGLLAGDGGLSVGYGGATPPAAGAIISGNVIIGSNSNITGKLQVHGLTSVYANGEYFSNTAVNSLEAQYQTWRNSVGTRRGYIGFPSYNDNSFAINNETGGHNLYYGAYHNFDTSVYAPNFIANGSVTSGSGSSGGFYNSIYVAGFNNIWSFGNATAYGIGYKQGSTGWYSSDTIRLDVSGALYSIGSYADFEVGNNIAWVNGFMVWHQGNDGSGSGLDADLLDGQHGSYYYPASNPAGYISSAPPAYVVAFGEVSETGGGSFVIDSTWRDVTGGSTPGQHDGFSFSSGGLQYDGGNATISVEAFITCQLASIVSGSIPYWTFGIALNGSVLTNSIQILRTDGEPTSLAMGCLIEATTSDIITVQCWSGTGSGTLEQIYFTLKAHKVS